MKKTAIIIMAITILSKMLGFGREMVLSYFYGASYITDAYLISSTIPSVIFGFVTSAIAASYIPIYTGNRESGGKLEADKFTSRLVNILFVLCIVFIIFGSTFAEPLVRLFASGFEGETLALATSFTRISLFSMIFSGLVVIFTSYLQVNGSFATAALIGFPLNIVAIVSIILAFYRDNTILAWGLVICSASQLIFMIPMAIKKGYRHKFVIDPRDESIKKVLFMTAPIILGVSVNQINVLVDRSIASNLAVGGISALSYAQKLNGFVQGMFVVSIVTVLYPIISSMAAKSDMKGLKRIVSESINVVNLLVIPATIGFMMLSGPIVELVFGRGAFDMTASKMTADALFFYSIGMIGFGLRDVLTRVFYSLQDTKTPVRNGLLGVGINIVLNIILSRYMGIAGLALATSISAIFTTGLMFITLRNKIGAFGLREIVITFGKITIASIIMGLTAKVGYIYLASVINSSLALLIAIGVGAILYFVIILFMKIEDVDMVVAMAKKKLRIG